MHRLPNRAPAGPEVPVPTLPLPSCQHAPSQGAGEGSEVLQPVPCSRDCTRGSWAQQGLLGGKPGFGLRGEQSIFCSGVPSDQCAAPGAAGLGQG